MDPGPQFKRLLYAQDKHRSESVWEEGYSSNNLLNCRRVEACVKRVHEYDPRMDRYLRQAGFYGVARLPFIQLDWALITSLVERWKPETHTFHMRNGEMTVTLEDVGVQLGLPINGAAVTGSSSHDWSAICRRLLSAVPERRYISFGRLKMKWLADNFTRLPLNASDNRVRQFTRAYILQLIGGMVFADKTQSRVHLMYLPLLEDFSSAGGYSWGSACLAWLYRQLCRASQREATQIAGPLILLHIWAWDRFPHISPGRSIVHFEEGMPLAYRWAVSFDIKAVSTHVLAQYREVFDRQTVDQIVWRTYTNGILDTLPPICISGRAIWNARVPLICFHVVEWHYPDRVIKQFGGPQRIPNEEIDAQQKELHRLDLRGKSTENWEFKHRFYVMLWNSRMQRVSVLEGDIDANYYDWYNNNSRPTISHTGTMLRHLSTKMQLIKATAEKNDPADMQFIGAEVRRCMELLDAHIAVRLHGRQAQDFELPREAAEINRESGILPDVVEGMDNIASMPSTLLNVSEDPGEIRSPNATRPEKLTTRGHSLMGHNATAHSTSHTSQVGQAPSIASGAPLPKRTKCNANRGRLLG